MITVRIINYGMQSHPLVIHQFGSRTALQILSNILKVTYAHQYKLMHPTNSLRIMNRLPAFNLVYGYANKTLLTWTHRKGTKISLSGKIIGGRNRQFPGLENQEY